MAHPLTLESVWFDKYKYDDAETQYVEYLNQDQRGKPKVSSESSLIDKIAKARQQIKQSLQSGDVLEPVQASPADNVVYQTMEQQSAELIKVVQGLQNALRMVEARVADLEKKCSSLTLANQAKPAQVAPAKVTPAPAIKVQPPSVNGTANDDDDDIDLFGSDEDNEADKLREERLKAYQDKKSKKPQVIAKSSIVLDVKPWDDETNMKAMEKKVREIEMDGLMWGASKLVPLAYGIHKLQIVCVVEDEKVSVDLLTETIEGIEDLVQSVDIAAFNKI